MLVLVAHEIDTAVSCRPGPWAPRGLVFLGEGMGWAAAGRVLQGQGKGLAPPLSPSRRGDTGSGIRLRFAGTKELGINRPQRIVFTVRTGTKRSSGKQSEIHRAAFLLGKEKETCNGKRAW